MRFYKIILFSLCAFLALAGCTVAFDSAQEDVFPCESDDDCLDGYECGEIENTCQEKTIGPGESPVCDQAANPPGDIDLDNDGYGTGSDRTNCPTNKRQEDCNDTDPNIYPNNTETCDGVDNNCDQSVDVFECPDGAAIECGSPPVGGVNIKFACVDKKCVLVHKLQTTEVCEEIAATCNSAEKTFTYDSGGQTYNLVDEDGNLQGPIADQCG